MIEISFGIAGQFGVRIGRLYRREHISGSLCACMGYIDRRLGEVCPEIEPVTGRLVDCYDGLRKGSLSIDVVPVECPVD